MACRSISVRENIALSDPGVPLEAVIHAAKMAGAHEFICALPEALLAGAYH
jgi:ATP-binding cassette, subfamily B, bacterial HlyB/CyaB